MKKLNFLMPDLQNINIDANENDSDPILYYQKPIIKWFYINRIQYGLNLLPVDKLKNSSILEVGYGSGLLMPTFFSLSDDIYGLDIYDMSTNCSTILKDLNKTPKLTKGNILKTDYKNDQFDLIVAFSILEHIKDIRAALEEIHRILKPGGYLLVGVPRVDKLMDKLFKCIGYNSINDHHFTSYKTIINSANDLFTLEKMNKFPIKICPLYFNMLLKKYIKKY